ncbi:MAG: TetR/AcrR family transcriptional regulator [Cyanobacteria bacterium J06641_5]
MNPSTEPQQPTLRSGSGKPDKAQAILKGALEVFTSRGYAAASMDRIAAAAKVSKPTLYSYFQDKEGLFVAMVQQLVYESGRQPFALPEGFDLETPPEKVLRQMATTVLEEFSHNQRLLTVMRLIIGESERFPEMAQTFVREIQKPRMEQLVAYFAAHPQLNFPDPTVAARIFAGSLVHYLLVQHVMHGSEIVPLERDRMIDGLIHLITTAGAAA